MNSDNLVQFTLNQNSAAQSKAGQPLTIYFDGGCYLCNHEINLYRRHRNAHRLAFIDINQPDFNATEHGLDPKTVHEAFHVRDPQGELLVGVPAFAAIWEQLGLQRLAKFARFAPVNLLMKLGYVVFAKVRPYLPRRSAEACATGHCGVPLSERQP